MMPTARWSALRPQPDGISPSSLQCVPLVMFVLVTLAAGLSPLKGATVGRDCGGTISAMQDELSAAKTNGVSPARRPASDAKRVARGLGNSQTDAIWDRSPEHAKASENDSAS